MENANRNEQFIDMDSDYQEGSNSYEQLIIIQIKKTAEVLSKEKVTNNIKQVSDNRETTINHVDTLKKMLVPFLKQEHIELVKDVERTMKKEIEEFGEKLTLVPGVGHIPIKKVLHQPNSIYYNRLTELKYEAYREIFGILVQGYHQNKKEIEMFSYE